MPNAHCPLPNAQCQVPARCPMPNAQCIHSNAQFSTPAHGQCYHQEREAALVKRERESEEREGAEVQGCEGRGGARMQGLARYLVTFFTAFLAVFTSAMHFRRLCKLPKCSYCFHVVDC